MGLSNPTHILLILVVVLLVFGAKRLPETGRSLGAGLREFKDSLAGLAPADDKTPAASVAPVPTVVATPEPAGEPMLASVHPTKTDRS